MKLLQHWASDFVAGRAATRLSALVAKQAVSTGDLRQAVEAAQRDHECHPSHYGLTFALAQACERIASEVPWDARSPWIEQARGYYEEAVRLAQSGQIAGASGVREVAPSAWEPGLCQRDRAVLGASFHAGLLSVAEFRVRDPARAIRHLTRVVEAVHDDHPAWYYLGEAYLLNDQFDEAERVWTDALSRSPGNATLRAVLENLPADRVHHAVKSGDWQRVLREIDRLPDSAMPASERWTIEGDAHLALGNRDAARRCWQKALEADRLAIGVRSRLRKLEKGLPSRSAPQSPVL